MLLFLTILVSSAFGQSQMDFPDFTKYNAYIVNLRLPANFSQSVVANASGPLRTYYHLVLGSSFAHPNASDLGIPYKQEPAPRSECSYQEDCNRFFTDMQPVNNGEYKLGGPLNLPTPQNPYVGTKKKVCSLQFFDAFLQGIRLSTRALCQ